MKFKISKKWLLKAALKEDKMPVSAGAFTFDMVANDAEEKQMMVAEESCTYLSFGRLINLRRRERGLTLESLAEMVSIDLDELVGIEQMSGCTPEPRTVCQLAEVLKLPEQRLVQLSGCVEKKDEVVTNQTVCFEVPNNASETLSREQKQILDSYIRYLENSDEWGT
jgi:HTH-type transcriptional regulator, competence development regulator